MRIISIAPRLEGGRALIKLTIGAMDDQAEVEFLHNLAQSKVFSGIRVSDEKYNDKQEARRAGQRPHRHRARSVVFDHMNWMSRSRGWKRVVLAGLGALVVVDLGLGDSSLAACARPIPPT